MRAVVQRAARAAVQVAGEQVAELPRPGLLVLVGITHDDGPEQVGYIGRKISELRILPHERSALEAQAPVLLISQFTLYADTRKGRRPSWNGAAPGPVAEPLVQDLAADLRARGLEVFTGVFGADMLVESANNGPVTIILDTAAR